MTCYRLQQGGIVNLRKTQRGIFFFVLSHDFMGADAKLSQRICKMLGRRRVFQVVDYIQFQVALRSELLDHGKCLTRFGTMRVMVNRYHVGLELTEIVVEWGGSGRSDFMREQSPDFSALHRWIELGAMQCGQNALLLPTMAESEAARNYGAAFILPHCRRI
jgi:hypothetical protein